MGSLVLSSKLTHLLFSSKTPSTPPLHHKPTRRCFPMPSVSSAPFTPINVDYLKTEFGSDGVSFTELGESCIVNMIVDNGSAAKLMLPSGLITSYKPRLWHGGSQEVLHTSVSIDRDEAVVKGGVSLGLGFEGQGGFLWSPASWTLKDVRGNRIDGVQVEMVSRDPDNEVEVEYTISLGEDSVSSDFQVSNLGSSMLELRGSILTHLTVSTPDATYVVGLEGSSFFSRPPMLSNFSIIPPNADRSLLSEGEESSNYKHLTREMSRIYTSAPRSFTVIDRGKRNSVEVGRGGFEEAYIYSPGSKHEWYGEYAYVCVGQAAVLKPIRLGGGHVWRGEQELHNPNL